MATKKETILQKNEQEIKWNIINSILAGALVFFGSLTNGFSVEGLCAGLLGGLIVFITKFRDYWNTQEKEYSKKILLFNFVGA
jgi:hypothetical protein